MSVPDHELEVPCREVCEEHLCERPCPECFAERVIEQYDLRRGN